MFGSKDGTWTGSTGACTTLTVSMSIVVGWTGMFGAATGTGLSVSSATKGAFVGTSGEVVSFGGKFCT